MNPSILPFDLGGTKTYSNTESNVGEENKAYSSDPMPEYNYKELKYNLPTTYSRDYHGSDDYHDNDFHGNGQHNDDFYDKDYHSNGDHSDDYRTNSYHSDDYHSNGYHNNEEDYTKAFDNDFGTAIDSTTQDDAKIAGIGSIVGKKGENLINEIGRKVLWNILQKQNAEKTEHLNGREVPELLGAAYENPLESKTPYVGEMTDSLPTHKGTVMQNDENTSSNPPNNLDGLAKLLTSSKQLSSQSATSNTANEKIAQVLEHFGLANTRVTQEAQQPVENDLNPKNDDQSTSRNVDIGGKMNDVIGVAKVTPPIITTPTSKATSAFTTTSTAVQRKINSNQVQTEPSADNDDVILKISGQGKPVSFKADTSSDGSLLLKIPKKFSEDIIKPNSNQATENKSAGDNSKDLSPEVIKLLAGKLGKNLLLGDQPQISDWEISGKQDKDARNPQVS